MLERTAAIGKLEGEAASVSQIVFIDLFWIFIRPFSPSTPCCCAPTGDVGCFPTRCPQRYDCPSHLVSEAEKSKNQRLLPADELLLKSLACYCGLFQTYQTMQQNNTRNGKRKRDGNDNNEQSQTEDDQQQPAPADVNPEAPLKDQDVTTQGSLLLQTMTKLASPHNSAVYDR